MKISFEVIDGHFSGNLPVFQGSLIKLTLPYPSPEVEIDGPIIKEWDLPPQELDRIVLECRGLDNPIPVMISAAFNIKGERKFASTTLTTKNGEVIFSGPFRTNI